MGNDNTFIKDDFIAEGDGQVASGSTSLPGPVALETEKQSLGREQNERVVVEALGNYKCDTGDYQCHAGMSVGNVPG